MAPLVQNETDTSVPPHVVMCDINLHTKLNIGDVAELVEGTSLLTRQGSNTLASSNLAVSATANPRAKALGFLHVARGEEIRKTERAKPCEARARVGAEST